MRRRRGVAAPDTMDQPFVAGGRVVVSMSVGGIKPYGARVEVDATTGTVLTGTLFGRLAALRGNRQLTFRDGYVDLGMIWLHEIAVTDTTTGAWLCCDGPLDAGGHPAHAPPLTLGPDAVLHGGPGILADRSAGEPGASGNGVRSFAVDRAGPCAHRLGLCPTWARPLAGTTTTAPVLTADGTTVVVGTDTGLVAAVDATTGALRWTAELGSAVTDTPALARGTLFVPTARGDLVALAAGGCGAPTCGPRWSARTGSRISQQPAVAGDVVVTGSANGALRAYATSGCGTSTCPALWSASAGSEITGAPAIDSGQVYVGTADGRLLAYGL